MKRLMVTVFVASLALSSCLCTPRAERKQEREQKKEAKKLQTSDKVHLTYTFRNGKNIFQPDTLDVLAVECQDSLGQNVIWAFTKEKITSFDTTFYVKHGNNIVCSYYDKSISATINVEMNDVYLQSIGFFFKGYYKNLIVVSSGSADTLK